MSKNENEEKILRRKRSLSYQSPDTRKNFFLSLNFKSPEKRGSEKNILKKSPKPRKRSGTSMTVSSNSSGRSSRSPSTLGRGFFEFFRSPRNSDEDSNNEESYNEDTITISPTPTSKKTHLYFEDEHEKQFFELYAQENLAENYFKYYELFQKYEKTDNEEKKKKYFDRLFNQFIDRDGEFSLNLDKYDIKRAYQYHKVGDEKGVQIIFRTVEIALKPHFEEFKQSNYQRLNQRKVRWASLKKKLTPKDLRYEDLYEQKELIQKVDTITILNEVSVVKEKKTNEEMTSMKMLGPNQKLHDKLYDFLNFPKHENIFKLKWFYYDPKVFDDTELIIIVPKMEDNLSVFIEKLQGKHLKEEEIVHLMKQVISVVQFYHENSKTFSYGRLLDKNIYVSKDLNVLIDPGFFYFQKVSNYDEKDSQNGDLLCLGYLFSELMLLIDYDELYKNKNELELKMENSKELYSEYLVNLVLELLNTKGSNRTSLDVMLKKLN
eukprot:gene5226-8838_t